MSATLFCFKKLPRLACFMNMKASFHLKSNVADGPQSTSSTALECMFVFLGCTCAKQLELHCTVVFLLWSWHHEGFIVSRDPLCVFACSLLWVDSRSIFNLIKVLLICQALASRGRDTQSTFLPSFFILHLCLQVFTIRRVESQADTKPIVATETLTSNLL